MEKTQEKQCIKTAKDAKSAIGKYVNWTDKNGMLRGGKIKNAFGRDVWIDGKWINRGDMTDLHVNPE